MREEVGVKRKEKRPRADPDTRGTRVMRTCSVRTRKNCSRRYPGSGFGGSRELQVREIAGKTRQGLFQVSRSDGLPGILAVVTVTRRWPGQGQSLGRQGSGCWAKGTKREGFFFFFFRLFFFHARSAAAAAQRNLSAEATRKRLSATDGPDFELQDSPAGYSNLSPAPQTTSLR